MCRIFAAIGEAFARMIDKSAGEFGIGRRAAANFATPFSRDVAGRRPKDDPAIGAAIALVTVSFLMQVLNWPARCLVKLEYCAAYRIAAGRRNAVIGLELRKHNPQVILHSRRSKKAIANLRAHFADGRISRKADHEFIDAFDRSKARIFFEAERILVHRLKPRLHTSARA